MENKLILVDVDNTLCVETCWTPDECLNATPNTEAIAKINELAVNNKIVIYTARRDYLIEPTYTWLKVNGVQFDMFSNKKVPGDLYIDTDSLRPIDL